MPARGDEAYGHRPSPNRPDVSSGRVRDPDPMRAVLIASPLALTAGAAPAQIYDTPTTPPGDTGGTTPPPPTDTGTTPDTGGEGTTTPPPGEPGAGAGTQTQTFY